MIARRLHQGYGNGRATTGRPYCLGDKMKTLILNGSPRVKGDTVSLVDRLTRDLQGEYKIVNAYRSDISACIDCRFCWENPGCAIRDGMGKVYAYIEECDNIVIASPVYFSELTGKLLDVGSRLQTYYCSRFFRRTEPDIKPKKGGIILVGGGDGSMERACETARILLHQMNCKDIFPAVASHNTNRIPAIEDAACVEQIAALAEFFNG